MSKKIYFLGSGNPNWRGGNVQLKCQNCGSDFSVIPSRKDKAICCSLPCWNKIQKSQKICHNPHPQYSTKGIRKKQWVWLNCKECGTPFEVRPSIVGLRFFCTHKCQFAWRSKHHSGKNNPNWQGGCSRNKKYPFEFYEIRKTILERDGYQCAVPMCRTNDSRVSVHHIDFNKQNCGRLNLITVCPSCNARANFDRVLWRAILTAVVKWREDNSSHSPDRGSIILSHRSELDGIRRGIVRKTKNGWDIQDVKP